MLRVLSVLAFLGSVNASPAFAKGRLPQLLGAASKNKMCQNPLEVVETFESDKPEFKIKASRVTLSAVDAASESVFQRAVEIYTDQQVRLMSGDVLDAGTVRHLLYTGMSTVADLRGPSMINLAVSIKDPHGGADVIIGFAQFAKSSVEGAVMKGLVTDRDRWFEISYHLDPAVWGQGYGSEIAIALVDYAMSEVHAEGVYAQTEIGNTASGTVLKNAGLVEIDRRQFPAYGGKVEGTAHYAITREQWEQPPAQHGWSIQTETIDGLEMVVLRVSGQVPTYSVVEIDANTNGDNRPLPRLGYDRFVQLTSTSPSNERFGQYISVPKPNFLGGSLFISAFELDRAMVESVDEDGTFDRRTLRFVLDSRFALDRDFNRALPERLANQIPENFLEMSIFEKKRVYEALAKVFTDNPGSFAPFVLHVLNSSGRDLLSRRQFAPIKN